MGRRAEGRTNKLMDKSITEIIEEVKEEMCDKFCKYPDQPISEGKTEDWMYCDEDSPCNDCPLNRL